MVAYVEVEDVKELARLNREMGKKLKVAFPYHEQRMIGWPLGAFPAPLHFMKAKGHEVFWWSPRLAKDKEAAQNFFGRGVPGETKTVILVGWGIVRIVTTGYRLCSDDAIGAEVLPQ